MGRIAELLEERAAAGEIPGAAWLVAAAGDEADEVLDEGAAGWAVIEPERVPALPGADGTIYDLASLTKPLVTVPLILALRREAGFSLSDPASRFLRAFERLDKRDVTLRHLLTHTSGLPDWAPLYLRGSSIAEYLEQIRETPPATRPGTVVRYSDLGYIALGAIAEAIASSPLEPAARSLVLGPSGSSATFRPGSALSARIAATEDGNGFEREKSGAAANPAARWRDGVIRGEVHDHNAWAAGGVAGHAGLFGTARDVLALAREAWTAGPRVVAEADQPLMARIQTGDLPEPRSLAYRVNRGPGGGPDEATAAGAAMSSSACGHNGFTGTSIWFDPEMRRVCVLLTNRVHPKVRESFDMNALRREFHSLAARA